MVYIIFGVFCLAVFGIFYFNQVKRTKKLVKYMNDYEKDVMENFIQSMVDERQ